nr:MAG TPA: hypothetical protein [Bacteriophage sp.]DAY25402.1 MAG TPA: hypothetical protein [Bacteriophage sp.]
MGYDEAMSQPLLSPEFRLRLHCKLLSVVCQYKK